VGEKKHLGHRTAIVGLIDDTLAIVLPLLAAFYSSLAGAILSIPFALAFHPASEFICGGAIAGLVISSSVVGLTRDTELPIRPAADAAVFPLLFAGIGIMFAAQARADALVVCIFTGSWVFVGTCCYLTAWLMLLRRVRNAPAQRAAASHDRQPV
jgi:hypothetical protein